MFGSKKMPLLTVILLALCVNIVMPCSSQTCAQCKIGSGDCDSISSASCSEDLGCIKIDCRQGGAGVERECVSTWAKIDDRKVDSTGNCWSGDKGCTLCHCKGYKCNTAAIVFVTPAFVAVLAAAAALI